MTVGKKTTPIINQTLCQTSNNFYIIFLIVLFKKKFLFILLRS